jgi:hypothetical protein
LDRLRELEPERLLYEGAKPGPGFNASLLLTPPELLDRLAALVPPRRMHRPPSLCRHAHANGRSPETSKSIANGWSWPVWTYQDSVDSSPPLGGSLECFGAHTT